MIRAPVKGKYQLIKDLQEAGLRNRIFPRQDLSSKAQNGSKVFVPSINMITLNYEQPRMGAGGTSKKIVSFIRNELPALAKKFPYVEFKVQPLPRRYPQVVATYHDGSTRVELLNQGVKPPHKPKSMTTIVQNLIFQTAPGSVVSKKFFKPVIGGGPSVVPIWDPFNSPNTFTP